MRHKYVILYGPDSSGKTSTLKLCIHLLVSNYKYIVIKNFRKGNKLTTEMAMEKDFIYTNKDYAVALQNGNSYIAVITSGDNDKFNEELVIEIEKYFKENLIEDYDVILAIRTNKEDVKKYSGRSKQYVGARYVRRVRNYSDNLINDCKDDAQNLIDLCLQK